MSMYDFWQQDSTTVAMQLFVVIVAAGILLAIIRSVVKQTRTQQQTAVSAMGGSQAAVAMGIIRCLFGGAGLVTILYTLNLPWLPLWQNAPSRIELGGLAIFFLWPFLALQVILALQPIEKGLAKDPVMIWTVFVIGCALAFQLDRVTLGFLSN
jgi:hypothetical protein